MARTHSISPRRDRLGNDLTAGNLLGSGKLGKLSHDIKLPFAMALLPDMVNLFTAQTDEQRNAAVTGLGLNTLLMRTSALVGPEGLAVIMA
jgi:hypothetical protein